MNQVSMPAAALLVAAGAVLSYLLGSLNFALIISRFLAKDDIRRHGSGNAGMTNMLRTYGIGSAVATTAGDLLKVVLAIALSGLLYQTMLEPGLVLQLRYLSALCALLGHLFPVYFGFKGGKGVVVSLGVILMTNWLVFLIILVITLPIVFLTRIVSLGSVIGAVLYPLVTFLVLHFQGRPALFETVCSGVIALIILWKHRENIKRLRSGTENRFGSKK